MIRHQRDGKSLILLDGSNLLHRALRIPDVWELRGPDQRRTGGVFQFMGTVASLIQTFGAFPLIVFDSGTSPRRLALHPDYKYRQSGRPNLRNSGGTINDDKQRSEDDYLSEYVRQRSVLMRLLSATGIPSFLVHDVEGDDILAFLAKLPTANLLVSEDKDMFQLLDRVDLYRPIRKQYVTSHPVEGPEQDQLPPMEGGYISLTDLGYDSTMHYLVAKSMIGDASDNIPGVKGIGEKSAVVIARSYLEGPVPWLRKMKAVYEAEEEGKRQPKENKPSRFERLFYEGYANFKLSLALSDLTLETIQAGDVETLRGTLQATLMRPPDFGGFIGSLGEMGMGSLIAKYGSLGHQINTLRDQALRASGLV